MWEDFSMMIEVLAFLFGLASWGILLRTIIKRKRIDKEKIHRMHVFSWMLCSLSLYMPTLRLFVSAERKNFHFPIDYADTYFNAASVLLAITTILTAISVLLGREPGKRPYLRILLVVGLAALAIALLIHEFILWTC